MNEDLSLGYALGRYQILPQQNTIAGPAGEVHVEPKTMTVLSRLASADGRTVSRQELIAAAWPRGFVTDDVLTRCIGQLRKAFADDPRAPRYLETIPKVGYRLMKPVGVTEGKSIAVLPFVDMCADPDGDSFSDGLSEELLNILANIADLRVPSRTSCFALKGQNIDVPAAGERLRVAYVLEGSVRKAGNRVRITAQLIEAATDSHLWSETYDRELDDIFAIQDDIAQKIVAALRVKIDPQALPDPTTGSARAYEYYLRGRGFFHKFGPKTLGYAVEMFRRATETDPQFARAWSGLSDAHAILAIYYGGTLEDKEAADRASKRAVELGPALAESHTSRGISHLAGERFEQAAAAFERAIGLDPMSFDAHYHYARTCFHMGNMERALKWFEKAAAIDPDDYQGPLIAAPIYRGLGEETKAVEAERRGVRLAEKHLADYPDTARAYYLAAAALSATGETEKALEWVERAIAIDPEDEATMYNVACFYAQVGEIDKAFECLEKALSSLTWIENDPELDPIRDDPRFESLVKRIADKKQAGCDD